MLHIKERVNHLSGFTVHKFRVDRGRTAVCTRVTCRWCSLLCHPVDCFMYLNIHEVVLPELYSCQKIIGYGTRFLTFSNRDFQYKYIDFAFETEFMKLKLLPSSATSLLTLYLAGWVCLFYLNMSKVICIYMREP